MTQKWAEASREQNHTGQIVLRGKVLDCSQGADEICLVGFQNFYNNYCVPTIFPLLNGSVCCYCPIVDLPLLVSCIWETKCVSLVLGVYIEKNHLRN